MRFTSLAGRPQGSQQGRRATLAVAPTICELHVRHSVMENERSGAYQPEAPLLHTGTWFLVSGPDQAGDAHPASRRTGRSGDRVEDSAWDEGDV